MRAGRGAGGLSKCAEPARQRAKTTVAFTDRSRNQCKRLVTECRPRNRLRADAPALREYAVCVPNYSARIATVGSTPNARRAGT